MFQQPPTETRIVVPWTHRHVGTGIAIVALAAVAIVFTLRLLYEDGAPSWAALGGTLVLDAVMIGVAVRLGATAGGEAAAIFGPLRLSTIGRFGWGLLALVGSLVAGAIYIAIASQISDDLAPSSLPIDIPESGMRWFAFATIALAGPFAEEVFFRGFVFAGLLRRYGVAAAVVMTSAVFAVAHLDIAVAGPAFVSGCIYALIYVRAGSLWPLIMAHTAQNAIAFALATV